MSMDQKAPVSTFCIFYSSHEGDLTIHLHQVVSHQFLQVWFIHNNENVFNIHANRRWSTTTQEGDRWSESH